MPRKLQVHIALFFVSAIYAATFSIAKEIIPNYVSPYGMIVIRVLGATVLFFITSFFIKTREKIDKKDWVLFLFSAFTGMGINMLWFFKGLALTTPINAAVMMLSTPLFVAIIAFALKHEKVSFAKICGLIMGLGGAALLILYPSFDFGSGTLWGDVYVMLNATVYAVYLVFTKPLVGKYHPVTVLKWSFLFGFFMVLPFGAQGVAQVDWGHIPSLIWWAMVFVIVGTTYLTYLLNGWALKHVGSSVAGAYIYLQPVLAAVIAVSLGMDKLTVPKVVFTLLIFLGVYLVSGQNKNLRKRGQQGR